MIELIDNEWRCIECGWHVGVDGISYWECDMCGKSYCENCCLPNVNEQDLWLCDFCRGDENLTGMEAERNEK